MNNSVGRSKATPFKQDAYKTLTFSQIYKTKCVFDKNEWCDQTYYLFDLTAGDASLSQLTSPTIILDHLYSCKGLDFKGIFVEKSKEAFKKLKSNVSKYIKKIRDNEEKLYFKNNTSIIQGNCEQVLSEYCKEKHKWKFGLLYYDPNGFKQEPWDLVVNFSKMWPVLDIVINFSPIQIKRNLNVEKNKGFKKYNKNLLQIINQIEKKDVYIRDDIKVAENRYKHIMLFCTNFGRYPELEKKHGFFHIESRRGQKIIQSHIQKKEENK